MCASLLHPKETLKNEAALVLGRWKTSIYQVRTLLADIRKDDKFSGFLSRLSLPRSLSPSLSECPLAAGKLLKS